MPIAHYLFPLFSEQISKRQSQIDRLYVSLKDLVEERKSRLEQQYWLYQLNREVDELEQWIAQKEVVASSPELGQDYEHVTVSVSADGVCRWIIDLRKVFLKSHVDNILSNKSSYNSNSS